MTEFDDWSLPEDGARIVTDWRPGHRFLDVAGEWRPEYVRDFVDGGCDGLLLNEARGFAGPSLEFLPAVPGLRQLDVLGEYTALGAIADCPELEWLTLDTDSKEPVPWARLRNLRRIGTGWRPDLGELFDAGVPLTDVTLTGYPGTDLGPLLSIRSLAELHLAHARRLTTLAGLSALPDLRVLDLAYCAKLADFTELTSLTGLVALDIDHCKQFTDLEPAAAATGLRRLNVDSANTVPTLAPLRRLTSLEEVVIGDTKVADGDLSPLEELPNLRTLVFSPRRHYNRTLDQFRGTLRD